MTDVPEDDPFAGLGPVGEGEDAEDPSPAEEPLLQDGPPEAESAEMAMALQKGATYALNDDGNGQRFALYFGLDLISVPRVGWFSWTGQVWRKDPDEIAVRQQSQLVGPLVAREVWHLALPPALVTLVASEEDVLQSHAMVQADRDDKGQVSDPVKLSTLKAMLAAIAGAKKRISDARGAHRRFAVQTGNSARMKSMREESAVRLSRDIEALDALPWDVNTLSGVMRFSVQVADDGRKEAAFEMIPHDRALYMTKIMPVRYDPDAECPEFDRFFAQIQPDPEMRRFLLRWFALAMTGAVEQKLVFLYGMGANGKSVLVDLMARIMGDYAATAKIESLTGTNRRGGGDATPDLVPLIGARFVRAAEPDEGVRWQEGLIKDLTGGEPILVRALHSDFVSVRPFFTLTISGNHKPDIRGTDDGIWRRLLLVPFDVTIPKAQQMPKSEIDALLYAERDGIFRKLVYALCEYRDIGLKEPATVLEATSEFREESDPYGTFLDEACLITGVPEDTISARELVNAFHYWMTESGAGAFKDRTVSMALKERSRRWVSHRTGRKFTSRKSAGQMQYDGIRFGDLFRKRWQDVAKDAQGRAIGIGKASSDGAMGEGF